LARTFKKNINFVKVNKIEIILKGFYIKTMTISYSTQVLFMRQKGKVCMGNYFGLDDLINFPCKERPFSGHKAIYFL